MNARRAFFWATAGQILAFVLNFAASVIIARLLLPSEVGTFIIGAAASGLCSAVTSFNFGAYVISEADLTPRKMDTAFTLNGLIALGLSSAMLVLAFFSNEVLGSASAGQIMLFLAATPMIEALRFRPATLLQRDMQFKSLTLINLASVLLGQGTTIVAALGGQSYMSQAWGALATSLSAAAGFMIVGARHMGFGLGLTGWRGMMAFGLRTTTITGAATAASRISEIILGRMLGVGALGIFSRAAGLSSQIYDNVYGTATRVAFSQLSKDYRETGELKASFLYSFRLITAIMWPFLAGLAILSPMIIHTLYGEKWQEAALPLTLLLVAQIIALGFGMNWELFVIKKETAVQTRIELLRNVAGLVAFSLGSLFSVAAASASRIFDNTVGLILYRKHVRRLSGTSSGEILGVFREGLLLTLVAVGPTAVLTIVERGSPETPLLPIGITVLAGIGGWYFALVRLGHPLADEIQFLTRKVFRMNRTAAGHVER